MLCVGMCSRFSTPDSLIYLQIEKWWELLELLTPSGALCITLFPTSAVPAYVATSDACDIP